VSVVWRKFLPPTGHKMKTTGSLETFIHIYETTRRHAPEIRKIYVCEQKSAYRKIKKDGHGSRACRVSAHSSLSSETGRT
jgi:hypothetical protein